MQFTPNALRFSPASVGALIDTGFLRSVLDDVQEPTHPDAAMAQASPLPARHWPLVAWALVLVHGFTSHAAPPADL